MTTLVAAAASAPAWTAHDTRLILCAAAAVAPVVLLVVRAGLHAFPALRRGAGEPQRQGARALDDGAGVGDTFRTWSAMETLISVVGLACVLGLGTVV